jgi:hypothetical protein
MHLHVVPKGITYISSSGRSLQILDQNRHPTPIHRAWENNLSGRNLSKEFHFRVLEAEELRKPPSLSPGTNAGTLDVKHTRKGESEKT